MQMDYTYIPGTYIIPELMLGEKLAIKNAEISVLSERPFPRDNVIVGFMGSAGKERDVKHKTYFPMLQMN